MKNSLSVDVPMMKKKHNTKHTPCFEMVKEAVLCLNNKNGSSPYAIAKLMKEEYNHHHHSSSSSSSYNLPCDFRKALLIELDNLLSLVDTEALFLKQIKEEVEMRKGLLKGKILKTYIRGFDYPNATQELKQNYINCVCRAPLSSFGLWIETEETEETEEEKLKKKMEDEESLRMGRCGAGVGPVIDFETNTSLKNVCCEALSEFNTLNGTPFKFVKVLQAEFRMTGVIQYDATFQAKLPSPHHHSLFTFQARGHDAPKDNFLIHYCRLLKQDVGGGCVVESKLDGDWKNIWWP